MSSQADPGLRFYRAACLVLLLLVVGLFIALFVLLTGRNAEREEATSEIALGFQVIDLRKRAIRLAAKAPDASDVSETYFASAGGTVHMHLLAAGQQIPLHIHRQTHELTAVISGEPDVVQVHGTSNGTLSTLRKSHAKHELIYSPPYCGHAWINTDTQLPQANLVFATPRFDGNYFVDDDDPRMLLETRPVRLVPQLDHAALQDREYLDQRTNFLPRAVSLLQIRGEMTLIKVRYGRALLVLQGSAMINAAGKKRVRADHLIILPSLRRLSVKANEPTLMVLFQPDAP